MQFKAYCSKVWVEGLGFGVWVLELRGFGLGVDGLRLRFGATSLGLELEGERLQETAPKP